MAESTVMSEEQRKQHIVQMKKLLERHWGNPAFLNIDGLKNLEDQELIHKSGRGLRDR